MAGVYQGCNDCGPDSEKRTLGNPVILFFGEHIVSGLFIEVWESIVLT